MRPWMMVGVSLKLWLYHCAIPLVAAAQLPHLVRVKQPPQNLHWSFQNFWLIKTESAASLNATFLDWEHSDTLWAPYSEEADVMELMPGKGPLWSADSASIEEKLSDGVLSREFKHAASHWCNSCCTLFYAGGLLGCGNIMLPKCSRWLVKPELLLDHCVRLTRTVQASSLPSCIFMGYRKRRRSRLWRENGPGLIRIFIPQRAGSPEWRAGLMTIHEMALI